MGMNGTLNFISIAIHITLAEIMVDGWMMGDGHMRSIHDARCLRVVELFISFPFPLLSCRGRRHPQGHCGRGLSGQHWNLRYLRGLTLLNCVIRTSRLGLHYVGARRTLLVTVCGFRA